MCTYATNPQNEEGAIFLPQNENSFMTSTVAGKIFSAAAIHTHRIALRSSMYFWNALTSVQQVHWEAEVISRHKTPDG